MEKRYLISAKENQNEKPMLQTTKNETDTLRFIRSVMLELQPMDETSADLKALQFLNDLKIGNAKCIENTKNGVVLVFQLTTK